MELKKILEQLNFSEHNGIENEEIEHLFENSDEKPTVNENVEEEIFESAEIVEVADNGFVKLYETENNGYINDTTIRKYIPELFPDFKFDPIDLNKCYLLGDENGFYFEQ